MKANEQVRASNQGPRIQAASGQVGLQRLGALRARQLTRLGIEGLRELLDFPPVRSARMLAAVSRGLLASPDIQLLADEEFAGKDASEAVSWPVSALRKVDGATAGVLQSIGVRTIGDLANLAQEADDAVLAALQDNGFRERPSAPAQLMPSIIGSTASSVRFTSFVRDTELRGLRFRVHEDCVVSLPISPSLKQPGSLAEIFETQKCPVLHLGYMCDHRQNWINLGTHLGEVVHSVSLAPGESRNIALVNWRRRQLTALEERTTTSERLTATFVQNRALQEITSAVAREHQAGQTQTEANTFVTAASFVGAGAVVGGIAAGTAGAIIGGVIGSAVPGLGTALGATAGGAVGAAVGGFAGTVAGGLVYSGSQVLGMIEADTEGDRRILAEVQQRIALSTSQTASAVRSLWSTVVVEDAQAEHVEASTSNITNYNHMHALNIEYYEVLQHYLARIDVERVQPLVFLPFTFFDFTNFRFVRDYWDAVRLHVEDEGLRDQGDAYFAASGTPQAPDLLPVPPIPTSPAEQESPTLTNLRIDVLFKSVPFNTDMGLDVMRGNVEISGEESDNAVPGEDLDGYDWGNRYGFADIADAHEITAVSLSRKQTLAMDVKYRIRVNRGRLRSGSSELENLRGQVIASNKTIAGSDQRQTFTISWRPAAGFEAGNSQALDEYRQAQRDRAKVLAINAARTAAYEALLENLTRFEQRLQSLILRRRHAFTRVILAAIEPEEIVQLLEALRIGHEDAKDPEFGVPLSEIAHTIPVGMTAGAFVLALKRVDWEGLVERAKRLGIDDKVLAALSTLLGYADQTQSHFETEKRKGALAQSDHIYVPTGGLFAEAILGRANSAEYLDMERFFNWQDSPIPHQPPTIDPVNTASRFHQGEVSVNVPDGNLQVINPVSLPDPSGMQGVLAAIQNPNLFRDMSKASELAGIVGSLTALAGQMGQAASTMTGDAAQQALQAASEVSRTAATMAQSLMSDAFGQAGGAFSTITSQGAALNKARELEQGAGGVGSGGGGGANADGAGGGGNGSAGGGGSPGGSSGIGGGDGNSPGSGSSGSSTSEDIVRKAAGLPAQRPATRGRASLNVRLSFESAYGVPIPYQLLGGMAKTFRLFHEKDVREFELGSAEELSNPLYVFSMPAWSETNGELAVELDYGAGSFKKLASIDIPAKPATMIVVARIASREQTITRTSSTSRTQSITEFFQQKFGLTASVAQKIAGIAELGIEASAEATGASTGTDSNTGTDSTTITELIRVPTGALDLSLRFKD